MPLDLDSQKKPAEKTNPELARREMARYDSLKQFRDSVFSSAWQTLGQYFLPNLSDINTEKTEGTSGWSDRIFDTTAIEDARTCSAGQGNWATPATEPWFSYRPPKFLNMEDDDDGALWSAKCTEITLDELSRSNYYLKSGTQYQSRTVFGTGPLLIEEGKVATINCRSFKINTYCIDVNDEDLVDTLYREFELTARQAAQMFGQENLGEKVRKALTENGGKNMDRKFKFLHAIRPRDEVERVMGKADGPNKAVASIYVSIDEKICVKIGGYDQTPFSVTRFSDWGTGTPWGYSPAFETLPNVRQLNYMVRFTDGQVELRANPRILEPVGLSGQLDLRPGGRTTFDPNLPGGGKPEEWMTQADVKGTAESIAQKQGAVHRMFYTDIFQALQNLQDRQRTAYEIAQRMGEKLEQLSPMFMRLITEKTGPDLNRIFGILYAAGKYPRPPKSMFVPAPMDGKKNNMRLAMPEVTYTSRLALALKSLQNKATQDTMQFITQFAEQAQKPEILDNFNLDSMVRDFAIKQGMPATYERSMKDVIKIRSARAKQQAQERAMALAEQASKAAKNLGGAPQQLQDQVADQIPQAQPAAA